MHKVRDSFFEICEYHANKDLKRENGKQPQSPLPHSLILPPTLKPEIPMHEVKLQWQGRMKFFTETPGGTIVLDTTPAVGGEDDGIRPKPLMLVALGGCTAMDVASLMKKMRVDEAVRAFQVIVRGHLTDEHPKYYDQVEVEYHFHGEDMNQKLLTKAVNLSINRYCGVIHMFKHFARFDHHIFFHETSSSGEHEKS